VESPSLEIFQARLDAVLCSLLWVTLLGQGVGLGDPQRSLPTLPVCDSVILCQVGGGNKLLNQSSANAQKALAASLQTCGRGDFACRAVKQ